MSRGTESSQSAADGMIVLRRSEGGAVAFRPGDPRSIELFLRLHRAQHPLAQLGFGILRRSRTAGRMVSALVPADGLARAGYLELMRSVSELLSEEVTSAAVNFTDERERATAALLMQSGRTLFVKACTDGNSRVAELAALLEEIASWHLEAVFVPEVVGHATVGRWTMTVISDVGFPRAGAEVPSLAELTPALLAFRSASAIETPLPDVLDLFEAHIESPSRELSRLIEALRSRMDGATVDVMVAHGDLVPWNINLLEDGLHLWDWDRAMHSAPWPYDAIHYSLLARRFHHGQDRQEALAGTLGDLRGEASSLGISAAPEELTETLAIYAVCRMANEIRLEQLSTDVEWLVDTLATML